MSDWPSLEDFEGYSRVVRWQHAHNHQAAMLEGRYEIVYEQDCLPRIITCHGESDLTDELAEQLGWRRDGDGWRIR